MKCSFRAIYPSDSMSSEVHQIGAVSGLPTAIAVEMKVVAKL
jgi:hypothetical protein